MLTYSYNASFLLGNSSRSGEEKKEREKNEIKAKPE